MYEYEFRLVVQGSCSFLPLLHSYGKHIKFEPVLYVEPHFRFRNKHLEMKNILKIEMVYYDHLWFKWVYSKEIPFHLWNKTTNKQFLHAVGNFQNPFKVEDRHVLSLDTQAKLYTFEESTGVHRLVFEWEYGQFQKPVSHLEYLQLLESLSRYREIYKKLVNFPSPPYVLKENITRKPVQNIQPEENNHCVYAHKMDGIFGLVYSYPDKIKEKWEDYERVIKNGITLGNGIVFAAEKLENGQVVLLDVYHVRGHNVAGWCRPCILMDFLPQLTLPVGYSIQKYAFKKNDLPKQVNYKTDGYIIHDLLKDKVYKIKSFNSIDLVYYKGYFWLPEKRIPCAEPLTDGCVYEISTKDGSVLRKRPDRFKGNTVLQLEREMKNGWGGPPIEDIPKPKKKKKKQKRKKPF